MKGFSLLELSIVVAVMAMLMAGATAGIKILDNTKILSSIKQLKELESAVFNFKEKYGGYPGDFSDAHRYFDDGTDTLCGEEYECNGDDDGYIEIGEKRASEVYRAWQHLELAKIIKGNFSGVWGEGEYYMTSPLDANLTIKDEGSFGNVIKIGGLVTVSGGTSDAGVVYPETAEKIDQKIDDAAPYKGQVRGLHGFLGGDITNDTNYDLNCYYGRKYQVSYSESKACSLAFLLY